MKQKIILLVCLAAILGAGIGNAGNGSLPAMYFLLLNPDSSSSSLSAHQAAVTGPLSNAEITAYRTITSAQPVEGPLHADNSSNLLSAGTFDLSLAGVADDDWVVVAAAGGTDIDHDGDGVVDPAPTANQGTLHAIARASDWRTKYLRITPLTELAYRYTEHLFSQIPQEELAIRLQDLARYLIKADIDGSGTVDWYDILAFDPSNPAHRDKLKTSYDWLTTPDENGKTVIASLLAGDEKQMLTCMDELYSYLMTRFPVPDSRYHSVKVSLSVFGEGSATSDAPANLTVDSTLAEPVFEDHAFLPKDENSKVTFAATTATGTQVLSWSGCNIVSADLSECTVPLNKSQSVVVNFGKTATVLNGVVHNLTRTTNTVDVNSIQVFIPDDMTDMIAEMATAAVDDFVVGDDGGGFLRRITAINRISSTFYMLDTVEASLDEIIQQGTGQLYKQMTNGDLEGYTPAATAASSAKTASTAFTPATQGVEFVPSNDPENTTFTITLGSSTSSIVSAKSFIEGSATVTLRDGLEATGQISFDITLDQAIDYSWGDLKSFKFITILDAKQQVELTATKELAKFDFVNVKIGSFRFSPIVFTIGVVPVWVSPIIDVYFFAEGKVSLALSYGLSFSQSVEGGVLYNRNTGWSIHKDFSSDHSWIGPTAKAKASIKGGIEARPVLKIYDATGPAIPQQVYAKMSASVSTEIFGTCSDIVLKNSIGFESAFLWDLSGTSKFGQMLHLDQLEEMTRFNIVDFEIPISESVLYDNCPDYTAGSNLVVKGNGIFASIDVGDANGLATSLTVENTGDETLHWNTSGIPAEVTVLPTSGTLAPGAHETVQMSLFTAGLSAGRYLHNIAFYNEASVGTGLPDEQFGNTDKTVDVNVLGPITDVPVLFVPTSNAVGAVTLTWDFSSTGTTPFVGFQIFATDTPADPTTYQHIYTADIGTRTVTIQGFTPGTTYSFDMRAYTNDGAAPGSFSNKVSVTVGGNPPPPFGVVYSAGQIWADRNLGASRVATSPTDTEAYGDLYQWGRLTDGHEKRNSSTTSAVSSSNVPGHGSFIITNSPPWDWISPQNDNLWQGASDINNPCPTGFRLPTSIELTIERNSWNSDDAEGAFASPLKFVVSGIRGRSDGTFFAVGGRGYYWSSTISVAQPSNVEYLSIESTGILVQNRAMGLSVRCLKD